MSKLLLVFMAAVSLAGCGSISAQEHGSGEN